MIDKVWIEKQYIMLKDKWGGARKYNNVAAPV